MPPVLYIFSGLPGAGKSTLSREIAGRMNAVYLRIDTLEQALKELHPHDIYDQGYRLSNRIAEDNLRLGLSVVADSCNPVEASRNGWEKVALHCDAASLNIEVICSDKSEHRSRIEERSTGSVSGATLWKAIESHDYRPWSKDRIVIDTAGKTKNDCIDALSSAIARALDAEKVQ